MFADLNAPRFNKRTFRHNIVSKELYDEWVKETGYKSTLDEFKRIWDSIAIKIRSKVISERDGVRLPSGLGDIYIGYTKCKRRPIDYKTSKELGKIIYFENWNTDGRLGKIIYGTSGRPYMYRLCKYWGFIPHTNFKDECTNALQTNPDNYKNSIESKYVNINKGRTDIGSPPSDEGD